MVAQQNTGLKTWRRQYIFIRHKQNSLVTIWLYEQQLRVKVIFYENQYSQMLLIFD